MGLSMPDIEVESGIGQHVMARNLLTSILGPSQCRALPTVSLNPKLYSSLTCCLTSLSCPIIVCEEAIESGVFLAEKGEQVISQRLSIENSHDPISQIGNAVPKYSWARGHRL